MGEVKLRKSDFFECWNRFNFTPSLFQTRRIWIQYIEAKLISFLLFYYFMLLTEWNSRGYVLILSNLHYTVMIKEKKKKKRHSFVKISLQLLSWMCSSKMWKKETMWSIFKGLIFGNSYVVRKSFLCLLWFMTLQKKMLNFE